MNRIRRWFLHEDYKELKRRLGKLEADWCREILIQRHAIEIARSIEEKVAYVEGEMAELATTKLRLSKLESAWQQQVLAQGHAVEVVRSVEEKVACVEGEMAELATTKPRLAKLESAWRQQISLQLHAMAVEDRLAAFESGWSQHIPAFLNAVSSVGAFGYELSQVKRQIADLRRSLEDRSEFVDAVPKFHTTVGSLENERDKDGAVHREIQGLLD